VTFSNPLASIAWGTKQDDNAVTYRYAIPGFVWNTSAGAVLADQWTAFEQQQMVLAFGLIAGVANLTFTELPYPNSTDLVLVSTSSLANNIAGVFGPPDTAFEGVGAFNNNLNAWINGLQQGGSGFHVILHELGHALGLAHPHDTGGSSTVMPGVTGIDLNPAVPGFEDYTHGDGALNQNIYTVMSYNRGWEASPDGPTAQLTHGHAGTLMALDIAALQAIYGANMSHNTGDNIYVLPDANQVGTFLSCIWDAGGTDEIRYISTGTRNVTIDLRAATLLQSEGGGGWVSWASTIRGGFTIANGVVIENASSGLGNDMLTGNSAANTLDGGGGADTMAGGDGNDIYVVDNLGDTATENAGEGIFDVVYVSVSGFTLGAEIEIGALTINAGGTLTGNGGANTLYGGNGDDRLIGAAGADALVGHDGFDFASYETASSGVWASLDNPHANSGDAQGDTYYFIESLLGSNFADTLFGDASGNDLLGLEGDDDILGLGGNDRLIGDEGADDLDGGDGFDTVDYSGAVSGVTVDLVSGGSAGEAAGDTFVSIERVVGSAFSDTLVGGMAGEDLLGGDGLDDLLKGYGGADRLFGEAGDDRLFGGDGADVLDGGAGGFDTALYSEAMAAVALDLASGGTGGEAAGDTFFSIERVVGSAFGDSIFAAGAGETVLGGDGDDVLVLGGGSDTGQGDAGNDYLYGQAGSDTLDGGGDADVVIGESEADILSGGAGDDYLFGGDGNDTIFALGAGGGMDGLGIMYGEGGADTLNGSDGTDYFYGGAGADTFNGNGGVNAYITIGENIGETIGDTIFGGSGQDYVYASDANDTMYGGANVDVFQAFGGDDVLEGGADVDYLYGGTGNDQFRASLGTGAEVLLDFVAGGTEDTIHLVATGWATFAEVQAAMLHFPAINTTIIALPDASNIWLVGVDPAQLTSDDFTFA
jgi:Ca2+-binding RTX toxin-like protein